MNCEVALERMLEADPEELRGELKTELAAHIADCARCSAVAKHLVESQSALAEAVSGMAVTPVDDSKMVDMRSRARATRLRSRVVRSLVPLAAAAALILLLRGDEPAGVVESVSIPIARALVQPPPVRVRSDKNIILMKTSNPRITVVWFY